MHWSLYRPLCQYFPSGVVRRFFIRLKKCVALIVLLALLLPGRKRRIRKE